MSLTKTTGRKLQILPGAYEDPHQLDLLSFVSEQLGEISAKEKPTELPHLKSIRQRSLLFISTVM